MANSALIPWPAVGPNIAMLPDAWKRASAQAISAAARFAEFLKLQRPVDLDGAVCIQRGAQPLGFARSPLTEHPLFVHLRGTRTLPAEPPVLARVNLVTGICLFGGRALRALDESGADIPITHPRAAKLDRPIVQIDAKSEVSMYELETGLRLCRALSDLVSSLPPEAAVTITVDIPREQYYCYLLDAHRHKLVSTTLMLRWFDLVDERYRLLSRFVSHLLEDSLQESGRGITVEFANSFAAVGPYLRAAVNAGDEPRLDEMIAIVESSQPDEPTWSYLFGSSRPVNVQELVKTTYVVPLIRAFTRTDREGAQLTVQVDDYNEWRIFDAARKHLNRLDVQRGEQHPQFFLGYFPLEQLLITDEQDGLLDSYFHAPERHICDPGGLIVDLVPIVKKIYGKTTVENQHDLSAISKLRFPVLPVQEA